MVRFKDLAWNCANIKKMFKEKDDVGVIDHNRMRSRRTGI